jgi:signal transduction histidine kinase
LWARTFTWRTPLPPENVPSVHDHRTIIVAPTGKDGRLIAGLFERLTIPCHLAASIPEACALIREGAGAAIISEEAFLDGSMSELLGVLHQQPSWSDFPLILLTISGRVTVESERLRETRRPLGNLFLLERPIRPETLLSTLEIALRGRERQYQIRDQIEQYSRAQEALLRSEKLAVTGRLAASIAHEINNPLEAVTNLLFLLREGASSDRQKKYLAQAEQELARVAEITKQTLRFYREPSQPTATRITTVLDSVLMLFGPRLVSSEIQVERNERAPSATVLSSPGELRQVIANIVGNAIDAMRAGGRLRIRIAQARQSVRVTMSDTGMGIPKEVLPTIFEPFVTTKGETGTGLGLWVTAEIIKRNGWKIRVRSCRRPGRSGTTFSIVIPALDSSGAPV